MRKLSAGILAFVFAAALSGANENYRIEAIDGFTAQTAGSDQVTLSRKHTGPVTAISAVSGTDIFYSAGTDGFVSRFGPEGFEGTWQVSELPVIRIASDPTGTRIATYESDGFSIHRVSVWDWSGKKRLFAKRFRDSVTTVSWSAQGTYLLVGHSSLEGITVFDGRTGSVKPVFSQSPGIVSLAVTGNTETSVITFGPSGVIRYTDLRNGNERASYQGEPDLVSPVLLNNNLVIAGTYDTTLYTVDATSGKLLYSYDVLAPVLATHPSDREPVWFENTGDGPVLAQGTSSVIPVPSVSSPIKAAAALENSIVFGTENGALYAIDRRITPDTPVQTQPLAALDIHRIDSIATDGNRLYILSDGSVFESSDPDTPPRHLFSGMATSNRITLADEGLLFWSSKTPASVIHTGFDGEDRTQLYEARDGITSLSLYGNLVSCIEGGSAAVVFDLDGQAAPFRYSGAGLQDAVLVNSERLIVSKSSTRLSPHVLLSINTRTGETVPVPLGGNLVYGLTRSPSEQGLLHAFRITGDTTAKTELLSIRYDPRNSTDTDVRVLARYGDEDTEAQLSADAGQILTTLGKTSLVEMIIRNGRQTALDRSYSLPSKPLYMNRYLLSLNRDGSLTWYLRSKKDTLSTAYFSPEGFWILE